MKKLLPAAVSILLVILLLVATMLSDKLIDRDRLQQVATMPEYVPSHSSNIITSEPAGEEEDDVPNITLTDAQGNTVTLDQFRGKTVVINFWASWSGPSYREFAMFQQAYNEYKDDVHFLMVNTTSDSRETREAADKMVADGGYTFPVYYDLDASAANEFKVISLPTSFFIDANGKAVAYAAGEMGRENLEAGLRYCRQSVEQAANAQATDPQLTDPTTDAISEES